MAIEGQEPEADRHAAQNLSCEDTLRETLAGLHTVLDKERIHLNSGRMDLLEQFAREKLHYLANLNRITRAEHISDELRNCREDIEQINAFLIENRDLLKFRMDAISEISTTIRDAVVDAESDGTYEASNSRNGFRPW